MKLKCPECQATEIIFGKVHTVFCYWYQDEDTETKYYDYEFSDSPLEMDDAPIECHCEKCNYEWLVYEPIHDYTE